MKLSLVLAAKRDAHRIIDTTKAALHLLIDNPQAAAERAIRMLL
ncbi:MAG TPA: hypothetical protein VNE67_11825 [Acetobacteraceae bacterium]|nr:hypothetical protein [Acetobacteraceae bacterium]